MCNVCNVCNATLLLLSIFIGNCLFFQEKLLERKSANYWPPGNLIEAITNAAVKRGSQGGQSNGDSIGSYPVLPTNNTRIAANCCDITISKSHWECSEAAKQRSGIQAANAAACCLSGARAPAYCLLAADSICRNLKDLHQHVQTVQQRFGMYIKTMSGASVTNSAVTCWHVCQNSEARSDEALQTLQTLHILE